MTAPVGYSPDQVLWPVTPTPGESLLSWIVRTSHENLLPSCYTILRRAGLDYVAKPSSAWSGAIDISALALILGSDEAAVGRLRCEEAEDLGFARLNGIRVRIGDLETNARRFAPAALAAEPVHLTRWMARSVPYCSRTWQYLSDGCAECGSMQRWRQAADMRRCSNCGDDLSKQPATPVVEALRPALSMVAALVSHDPNERSATLDLLPKTLRSLDAGEALELVQLLARVTDCELPSTAPITTEPAVLQKHCRALASAWTMMLDYPESATSLLEREHYSSSGGASKARMKFLVGKRARLGSLPGVDAAIGLMFASLTDAESSAGDHIRVKPAARMLGITETEMAKARDTGIVQHGLGLSRGRLLKTLDGSEITQLAHARRTRVGEDKAGRMLGVPAYGVLQLAKEGLLKVEDHPWLVQRYGGFVTTTSALDIVTSSLNEGSMTNSPDDATQIRKVLRGYGGGPKPWAAVVRMMLSGELPYYLDEAPTIGGALIPASSKAVLLELPFGSAPVLYSQSDAVEVLNLHMRQRHVLAPYASIKDHGKSWSIKADSLHRLAGIYVSTAELMARYDHHARGVRETLLRAGVSESDEFGWYRDRSAVLKDLLT